MSFVLKQHTPALVFRATLGGLGLVLEQGDIQITCFSNRNFIFSTVKTKNGGWHPVSGNRGFGLIVSKNTWTFYTMGADREVKTDIIIGDAGEEVEIGYIQNSVGPIFENATDIFELGHRFWMSFF